MTSRPLCPHCNSPLLKWRTPDGSTWGAFLWVCFNDECSYYVQGWTSMEERFGRKASYRHSLDPDTGATGPLPVWSATALRTEIIEEPSEPGGDHNDRT